jgi:hypothetical protein
MLPFEYGQHIYNVSDLAFVGAICLVVGIFLGSGVPVMRWTLRRGSQIDR